MRSNGYLCRWRSSPSPPCVNPHHVAGCYRPQRSCGKVMFLHLSVSHSVHEGVSASVHAGIHPPGRYTRSRYTPRQVHPPGTPPWQGHPLADTPPGRYTHTPGRYTHPPWQVHTHPRQVHPPRRSLQRTVRILLECFLVFLFRRSRDTFTGYNGTEIH